MDKRSLLIGLGMGIIIGSLLMQLSVMGEQSTKRLEDMDNMISNSDDATPRDAEQGNRIDGEHDAEDLLDIPEDSDQQIDAEDDLEATPAPDTSEEEQYTPDDNGQYSTDEQSPKTVLLRIYSGSTVSQIAAVLEKHSIIENKSQFTNYTLDEKKRIRAGYFLVKEQSTDEEVLEILTSHPVPEDTALDLQKNEQYDTIFSR